MTKLAGILALCWACVGCETGPTQPRRALSPIEACFSEALSNSRSCALMAAGSGMRIGDATANRNMQICDEKKRNHEIYCVQMYGQPQQRQNITTPPASNAIAVSRLAIGGWLAGNMALSAVATGSLLVFWVCPVANVGAVL